MCSDQTREKQISKELQANQKVKVNEELKQLKKIREEKGKCASIYSLREKILGKRKTKEEPTAIMDPETKKLIFKPSEILRVSVEYCQKLLTNDSPKEEFEKNFWRVHEFITKMSFSSTWILN